jgi:hypothetical protein
MKLSHLATTAGLLSLSATSLARPAFVLPPYIAFSPGVAFDVPINGTNLGDANGGLGIQGMNLYVGVTAPFEIIGMQITGVGMFTSANSNPPSILSAIDPQTWQSSVTTRSGYLTGSGTVATVTVLLPWYAHTIPTYDYLTTDITDPWGVMSDFAGIEADQARARLVPEPSTLTLLALAGLVIARRRVAS